MIYWLDLGNKKFTQDFILFEVEEYRMENDMEACDVDLSKVLHFGRGVGAEDHEAQRVIQVVWRKMLMCR